MSAKPLRHLPDLPTAGYSSRRQKETTDAIMFFLRGMERRRPLLLDIVLGGRDKFQRVVGNVWRGLLIDREVLDSVYGYLCLLALCADKRVFSMDPERAVYLMGRKGLTPKLHALVQAQADQLAKMAKETPADRVWKYAH